MIIKEVEKLTGLTAKAIRHYEKEGLINVGRNKINSYRNYSEQDVEILKKIKLFRYMEFSIEEIKQILQMENEKVSEQLVAKAAQLQQKNEENDEKKEICLNLSKDIKKGGIQVDKYEDMIKFNEDDEIKTTLKEIEISSVLALMFTCLVPIISLFVNIENQRWDMLIINSIAAIISTIILTLNFRNYIFYCKNERKIVKDETKKSLSILPVIITAIIIFAFLTIILNAVLEYFIAPEGWLFYEIQSPEILIHILILCPVFYLGNLVGEMVRKKKITLKRTFNIKMAVLCFIMWIIGIYICFTNVTFVTENSIVCYSPVNLSGTEYSYNEISKVEAKFGNKTFALNSYERKGNFQYTIYLEDKKVVFYAPTTNSGIELYDSTPNSNIEVDVYIDNTYLELEQFDEKLMQLEIPKESDETNSEKCDLDQVYVDRFLRIIRNK